MCSPVEQLLIDKHFMQKNKGKDISEDVNVAVHND